MKVKVEFITDFATKKKGNVEEYAPELASTLIKKKVAKLYKAKSKK